MGEGPGAPHPKAKRRGRNAVKDREAVLKAIRDIPTFHGVTGDIVFDEKGDNKNQIIGVFKVEAGELQYLGPAE